MSEGVGGGTRADIQFMRAVAVLLVALYHAELFGVTGGFIGVDVFLVLSGYLITGLLQREYLATGRIDLLQFWGRRMRRLTPAATVAFGVTLGTSWLLLAPMETVETARLTRAAAAFGANIQLALNSRDYFAADAEANPLLHTWSLSVEEQFYFVWPPLLWLLFRLVHDARRTVRIAAVLLVVSLLGAEFVVQRDQSAAFFQMPLRAWEFLIGGVLAMSTSSRSEWVSRPGPRSMLGWGGLFAVVCSAFWLTSADLFPGARAIPAALGTAMVLMAGESASPAGPWRAMTKWRPMTWLGDLSYSFYLWHWPILVFLRSMRPEAVIAERATALGLSLVLAAGSYYLVETPFRNGQRRPRAARRALLGGIAACALSVLIASGVKRASAAIMARPPHADLWAAREELPRELSSGCMAPFKSDTLAVCAAGVPTSPNLVALLGDSHAGQFLPALDSAALHAGVRLVMVLRAACPIVDVDVYSGVLHRPYRECSQWRRRAFAIVDSLHPQHVIFINSNGPISFPRQTGIPDRWRVSEAAWIAGLHRSLARLSRDGTRVTMLRDTPRLPVDVPSCVARSLWRKRAPACDGARSDVVSDALASSERAAVGAFPNARYLDLTERYCTADKCAHDEDGRIRYRDDSHFTVAYARTFAPLFERVMRDPNGTPVPVAVTGSAKPSNNSQVR